jgi:pimeloyl-ACP methyl ester carboxylesterase
MARRPSSMINLLLILPLGYLMILVVLYFNQDNMVFVPTMDTETNMDREAATRDFEPWRNAKGERIGWQSRGGDPSQVLLICGGNGGYALRRAYYRADLAAQGCDWKIFLLEYPGYGARPGKPSEQALTAAAINAFDILAAQPGRTIRVVGESLGSGVASALAAARSDRIAGLVLVTPFDSLSNAASSRYPWLPVGLLLRTKFDSMKNLKSYPGPVAFVIGENDRTVPTVLGEKLFAAYPGRKQRWLVPRAGHDCSSFIGSEWRQVMTFLGQS